MKTRYIQNLKVSSVLLLLVLSLSSCIKKDDFDFDRMARNEYESEWAIPVINKRYFLSDMIADSATSVIQDDNTFLTVVHYTGDLWTTTAEELIFVPDQSFSFSETVPAPMSAPVGGFEEMVINSHIQLDFSPIEIDSILFKAGVFKAFINTNINHKCDIEIILPQITNRQNNQPLVLSQTMNSDGNTPASGNTNLSLTNYKMSLPANSQLEAVCKLKVYNDGHPFNQPTYSIDINTAIEDIKFKLMFGYFGMVSENLTDTIEMKLFKKHFQNSIQLSELKAHLFMKSSFGMPLRFRVDNFSIYTGGEERYVIAPGYQVDGPYATVNQVGQMIEKHDTTFLNPNVLEISPKYMAFDASGILNPNNDPSIRNFVTDDSKYSIDARLELPMEGRAIYFTYKDTMEFFFEDLSVLENMIFKVNVENRFPIDAKMQIYITDENYVVLDSLFLSQDVIPSATVGPAPTYYTTTPGTKTMEVPFGSQRLENIYNSKWLIVEARLNTYDSGNQFVRLYGNQSLYVSAGTRVKLKIDY